MDTFVREAIARATFERTEVGGDESGGDFLEVCQRYGAAWTAHVLMVAAILG